MELLLNRSIDSLGRVGDVVDVSAGYARNYLLPNGYAVPVTKANLDQIKKARVRAMAEEAERMNALKGMAEKLADVSITIEARANEDGHLFGSVTSAQIAGVLRDKGYSIEDRMVRMETPLREIGVFDVAVHLHGDVESSVKVWVVQSTPA